MDEKDLNRALSSVLGWTPEMFGRANFDDELVEYIRRWQQEANLAEANGVCDERTYSAYLSRKVEQSGADELRDASAPGGDALLKVKGEQVVARAKAVWLEGIVDPPSASSAYAKSRARIDGFIRGADGLHWTWEDPYIKDGDFKWCGAFASHAWAVAGVKGSLRKRFFSSTYRLDRYGQYKSIDESPAESAPATGKRKYLQLNEKSGVSDVLAFGPRPGDILLVGGTTSAYGAHITVIERFVPEKACFVTLEGNASGNAPNGGWVEGVIRRERPIGLGESKPRSTYHARRLIRPSLQDLV